MAKKLPPVTNSVWQNWRRSFAVVVSVVLFEFLFCRKFVSGVGTEDCVETVFGSRTFEVPSFTFDLPFLREACSL